MKLLPVLLAIALALPVYVEAGGKDGVKVPVIGRTKDGKYPRYDLKGDLDDINYFGITKPTVWPAGTLEGRLVHLKKEDLKRGYECDWVCKDPEGYIVGLRPKP